MDSGWFDARVKLTVQYHTVHYLNAEKVDVLGHPAQRIIILLKDNTPLHIRKGAHVLVQVFIDKQVVHVTLFESIDYFSNVRDQIEICGAAYVRR